jgi:hypothetical protein
MKKYLTLFALLLSAAAAGVTQGASGADSPSGLVVHEWGTFTSIAGEDGRAIQWFPQAGPTDLPCFVERIRWNFKNSLSGTVRMETPVLYFYAPREMTVNVDVQFRQGVMTEWFPRPVDDRGRTAAAALKGGIAWKGIRLRPAAREAFPTESQSNHYYVARQTDASPLQSGAEHEKFLFYRGVGRLPPPIAATVASNGDIAVRHTRGDDLGDVMLFQNRDGAVAYQRRHVTGSETTFNLLVPVDESGSPQADLERMLVSHGLFAKEAKAMVDSWRDSWFESGTRLFYIVSNKTVDAMLPLHIDPQPAAVARVFVGRMEIVTPATMQDLKNALSTNDSAALRRHGRFLDAIGKRLAASLPPAQRPAMERRLQSVQEGWLAPANPCRESN